MYTVFTPTVPPQTQDDSQMLQNTFQILMDMDQVINSTEIEVCCCVAWCINLQDVFNGNWSQKNQKE